MTPAHYKIAGQLQHHQALPLPMQAPAAARVAQAQLALNDLLTQADIDELNHQLADNPASIQTQILKVWFDWRESVESATSQHSGYAPSGLWLACKLAQLECQRDLAVKEIVRKHYIESVQLYALARVPGRSDDAAARALFPKWR